MDRIRVYNSWTNSYPIGFHLNGTWWACKNAVQIFTDDICKQFWAQADTSPLRDDLTIVYQWFDQGTSCNIPIPDYTTSETPVLAKELLLGSLEMYKVPAINLAEDWDWKNYEKPVAMKPHLLAQKLDDIKTKYIMGWDVDVFFTDHPNNIVDRFEELFPDVDWLFNSAQTIYPASVVPLYQEWSEFAEMHTNSVKSAVMAEAIPWRFLNSGLWIAKTEFLREIADELPLQHFWPDDFGEQGHITHLYKKYYGRIQQDFLCRIFQTLQIMPLDALHVKLDLDISPPGLEDLRACPWTSC